jgi:acyl-CoA thioester hydrolase
MLCARAMNETVAGMAAGRLLGDRHLMPIRVYYEDTDFSGVVYHANYLRFLERGRTEFIRSAGIDQLALHREDGIAFVVRSMSVEFVRPALMDDVVEVETRAQTMRGPLIALGQVIRRGGEVLTMAQVAIACVKGGRPQRLPAGVREALARLQAAGR